MITKWAQNLYRYDCGLFHSLNCLFERKVLNMLFSRITYFGGATFTIAFCLFIILFVESPVKMWGFQSGFALLSSHLVVMLIKKIYPRERPYISIKDAFVDMNPLKDHSFPSGHTTAIFSIITPFIIHLPIASLFLYPIGFAVGASRIVLGLHYPSDVLVGALIGTVFAILFVTII